MTWVVLSLYGVSIPLSFAFAVWLVLGVFMQSRASRHFYWTPDSGAWTFAVRVVLEPAVVLGLAYLALNLEVFAGRLLS